MDTGVAEDVAQDAFVRMRDRFVSLDNPAGYLRVAVVNCARSATSADARRRAREARFSEERERRTFRWCQMSGHLKLCEDCPSISGLHSYSVTGLTGRTTRLPPS